MDGWRTRQAAFKAWLRWRRCGVVNCRSKRCTESGRPASHRASRDYLAYSATTAGVSIFAATATFLFAAVLRGAARFFAGAAFLRAVAPVTDAARR